MWQMRRTFRRPNTEIFIVKYRQCVFTCKRIFHCDKLVAKSPLTHLMGLEIPRQVNLPDVLGYSEQINEWMRYVLHSSCNWFLPLNVICLYHSWRKDDRICRWPCLVINPTKGSVPSMLLKHPHSGFPLGKAFSSQGKVREFWTDWKSQGKSHEILENWDKLR